MARQENLIYGPRNLISQGHDDVMNLREVVAVAVESLSWMEIEGLSERLAFAKTVRQLNVRDPDSLKVAFLLVTETVRSLNSVDRIASSILSKEYLDDLDLGKRNFLRIFIYWSLLRKSCLQESAGLLDAARQVLGWKALADLELAFGRILTLEPRKFFSGLPDLERTGLWTFNRAWFVSYCHRTFGRDFALRYLKATQVTPPTYLAVNTLRGAENDLVSEIEKEQVTLSPVKGLDGLFRVDRSLKPLTTTKAYGRGFFCIQDKSSYLSIAVAEPKRSDVILDLCAAPGGKTWHMAVRTENSSTIYSIDYSPRRMSVWKKEMARCNVTCAVPVLSDARRGIPMKEAFDLVVVDPPCTNSGALGKIPSAKWRLTPSALNRFCQIQSEILRCAAETVRPGGRLVYSTCSVMVEENELQIERLLKLNPEFKLERHHPFIGHEGLRGFGICQRLYPHLDECNGYFIASLRREY